MIIFYTLLFWCTSFQTQNLQVYSLIFFSEKAQAKPEDEYTGIIYTVARFCFWSSWHSKPSLRWLVPQTPVMFLLLFWRSWVQTRLIICDILIFCCNSVTLKRLTVRFICCSKNELWLELSSLHIALPHFTWFTIITSVVREGIHFIR